MQEISNTSQTLGGGDVTTNSSSVNRSLPLRKVKTLDRSLVEKLEV